MSRFSIPGQPIRSVRVRTDEETREAPEAWRPPPVAPPPPPPPPPAAPAIDFPQLIGNLEDLIRDHEEKRKQSLSELQLLAVELAIAAASQVVHQAIEADQFGVRGLVDGLIDKLGLADPIRVALHPADLKLLQAQLAETPPAWSPGLLTFTADPGLARGSCRGVAGGQELLSEAALHLAEMRRHLLEGLDDAEIERRHSSGQDQRLRRFPDRRETA
jgi:hypothetical protein